MSFAVITMIPVRFSFLFVTTKIMSKKILTNTTFRGADNGEWIMENGKWEETPNCRVLN
jgi:hypothetical protein